MRTVVAVLLGAVSGFLIYLEAVMLTMTLRGPGDGAPSSTFVAATFLGGWALSSYAMRAGARTTSRVLARAFLIGAAEWLAMVPVGFVVAGSTVGYGNTGALVGTGFVASVSTAFCLMMAMVCMLGFAVVFFMRREMPPEASGDTKQCPECAETVKAEARKCRHCGADLRPTAADTVEWHSGPREF